MPFPIIAKISSYENVGAIREFIQTVLETHPEISSMLREGDPSRLIVVKPNWVEESHPYEPDVWLPLITHPVVLICILEKLAEMMRGRGHIAICDAPNTYADFDGIMARGALTDSLESLRARWPDLNLELIDLRRELWIRKEGVVVDRIPNSEDPRGYVQLDLGKDSLFYGHPGEGRYYGADYDTQVINAHHRGDLQEYLLAGTPMACDLFINVPKLKTHKKTGITCCLKNLVGITGDKNWLPHFVQGSSTAGGDEFPGHSLAQQLEISLKRAGQKIALSVPGLGTWAYRKMRNTGIRLLGDSQKTIRGGDWSGNDTCWRMVLDLNRALLYGNTDGSWKNADSPKRYLAIVDGIIGGQGNGPLCPEPAEAQVLLGGDNPAIVDAVAARLMGVDVDQIPMIRQAFESHRWPIATTPLDAIVVSESKSDATQAIGEIASLVPGGFKPHFGWPDLNVG